EQARKDVERTLAARRLLDDHRHQGHAASPFISSPWTVGPQPHGSKGRTATSRVLSRVHACVFDQEVECLALTEPQAKRLEVTAFFHHTPYGRRRALAGAGDLLDLGVDLVVARG